MQVAQAADEWDAPAPADFPEAGGARASLAYVGLAVTSIADASRLFSGVLEGAAVDEGRDEAVRWVELTWKGPGRLRLLEPDAPPAEPIPLPLLDGA